MREKCLNIKIKKSEEVYKRKCLYAMSLAAVIIISVFLTSCTYDEREQCIDRDVLNINNEYYAKTELPLFDSNSVINTKIDEEYIVDVNSREMIERLVKENDKGCNVVLSIDKWSVSVYYADNSTERNNVQLLNNWGLELDYMVNVPIEDFMKPDSSNDGHLCIIDIDNNFVYEFWQFQNESHPTATWGNRISLDSDGIYSNGMSARGSGISLIAGVIFPEELEKGEIDHALAISLPCVKAGGPVYPATESDGKSLKSGAIPEGARLQLNPALDLDSLDLSYCEYIICKALQEYGAFVVDVSSSIEFEIVNPVSYDEDIYSGYFEEEWTILNNIPLDEFHVLELGKQVKKPKLYVEDMNIYE